MNAAYPHSINEMLASYLQAQSESMVAEWLEAVSRDASIPTASHTTEELRDHLPALFGNLVHALRSLGPETIETRENARMHGTERWRQGFSPRELLREIKHLRHVLVYHLRVFEDMHPQFGGAARIFACAVVHGFLDDLAIEAIDAYCELEHP